MATRLYFHNALNTSPGTYSQGLVYNTLGYGIAYGNGTYICHNGTQIQRSVNGIDWDDPINVGANSVTINSIGYGNGVFVVANGASGVGIWRSTDNGLTWTQTRTPSGVTVAQNVLYRNGWWFVASDGATVYISNNDGVTWSTATLPGLAAAAVAYYVGYNSTTGQWAISCTTNAIYFTTDPAGSWTAATGPVTNSSIKTITWNNSLWIVSLSNGTVYTTPTMSAAPTWTQRTVTNAGTTTTWQSLTMGSTTVIVGSTIVYSSTNGTTWTNYNNTGLVPNMNGQIWYGGTTDDTAFWIFSAVSVIMRSTNGTSWRRTGGPLSNTVEFIGTTPLGIPAATAYKMRTMNTTIGTSQANLSLTTSADAVNTQNNFIGFFTSEPLLGAQTVGGGTMIFNTAELEANLASNWWINGLCVYVWRPSTGEVVGYVRDYQGVSLGGLEPTAAAQEQVTHITGITTSAVAAQTQDVIVCEIWVTALQGMASAYLNEFYFDGTTVNTTENAVVTSQASFLELTENLTFGFQPFGMTLGPGVTITPGITVQDTRS